MSERIFVAISGKKRSGKDSCAEAVKQALLECGVSARIDSFAAPIKQICTDILGIEHKQCHGSDDDKNTPTSLNWSNLIPYLAPNYTPPIDREAVTAREAMQFIGEHFRRVFHLDVWVNALIKRSLLAPEVVTIITDMRYRNEVRKILEQPRGVIIRLTRNGAVRDWHSSEVDLNNFEWNSPRTCVFDNAALTLDQQQAGIVRTARDLLKQYEQLPALHCFLNHQ